VAVTILVVLSGGATVLGTGAAAAGSHRTPTGDARQQEMVQLLRSHYYRYLDPRTIAGVPLVAIPTVLDDPYTHYLDPAALDAVRQGDEGRYVGIGIHARLEAGQVVLDRVSPGSPATAAGLIPGDTLLRADGRALGGTDLEAALTPVRGAAGTSVALVVRRGTHTLELRVPRREVEAQLVFSDVRTVDGVRVGYVHVLQFGDGIADQARRAVQDFRCRGVSRVVLDLRGNGGGLVREAVRLVAVLVPTGMPVLTEAGEHVKKVTYRTTTEPADPLTPLAVLVDGDTASAAEIAAGALQDQSRATVIGTRTFGKGVVQDILPLQDGGALKYTMAEYLTPDGHPVQRRGITPDVLVDPGQVETALPLDRAVQLPAATNPLGRAG
jgi:carboxyl-terminal processing protease